MGIDNINKIDKIDLLENYVQICDAGSLSRAAENLGVAPATVSRKLTSLEKAFDQTLITRSTHTLFLTALGEKFLIEAKGLLHHWKKLEDRYRSVEYAMVGPLHVVVPEGLGLNFFTDVAIDFQKTYPGIELTWVLQNAPVDFKESGCDLWIRMGACESKNAIKRKLAITGCRLVASPDFVGGLKLNSPASVEKLPCVAQCSKVTSGGIELTSTKTHKRTMIYPEVVFSTNNFFALHAALLQGVGFGVLPDWFLREDLTSGRLVELIPEWQAPSMTLNAITRQSKHDNQRAEAFIEKLSFALNRIEGLRLTVDKTVVSLAT